MPNASPKEEIFSLLKDSFFKWSPLLCVFNIYVFFPFFRIDSSFIVFIIFEINEFSFFSK